MIYSKIVGSINMEEFDSIYKSSEPYLIGGNYGESCTQGADGEWYIKATPSNAGMKLRDSIQLVFQQVIDSSGSGLCAFELRETGTDHLLALKVGSLVDGTFNTWISLFQADTSGTLSWVFNPPSDPEVIELMAHTGIKRVLMKPTGKNLENFIIAIGSVRVNDSDTGVHQYKSTWGWDNYETDLVDM
tara:strand:- start:1977 stop:2540 length:564 start_codon:yes stop_codon:yes gene_type:complete